MWIPKEITDDLRAGMTLEETLIKHNTNLRELFAPEITQKHKVNPLRNDCTNIRQTKHNTFRVGKQINKRKVEFGTYATLNDAILIRDELIKCDWNKKELPNIIERLGIVKNTVGGYRRCLI